VGAVATIVPAPLWSIRNAYADVPAMSAPATRVIAPNIVFLIGASLAGRRLIAVGEQGVILYSDDVGVSWRQAATPVSVTLVDVAFFDALHGWAAGGCGIVLSTQDGGTTWQKVLDGDQVNSIMSGEAARYAKANPGSDASQRALRRAGIFMQGGPDKPFLSVLALGPAQAILLGAYRMAMRTDDGGKTWTDLSLRVDDPISHNLDGSVRIGDRLYVVGETGLVFCSTDGGYSFPQISSPAQATLFGVCGTGGDGVLAYGVAGQIFHSEDCGKNWTASMLNLATNLTAACKAENNMILTAMDGQVYTSADQGTHFRPLANYSPSMQVNDVLAVSDGRLLLVGRNGPQVVAL
jgi:photosystem II stability/assembly factor-like uncharacterized protein